MIRRKLLIALSFVPLIALCGFFIYKNINKTRLQVTQAEAGVGQKNSAAEALRNELKDPGFADQTGFLEVIEGAIDNSRMWLYSVHSPAGPIWFLPAFSANKDLMKYHGSFVRIRESEKGFALRTNQDNRRFQFELLQEETSSEALTQLVAVYSPYPNGPRTKRILRSLKQKNKAIVLGPFEGPECLSEFGHELYPSFDNTVAYALEQGIKLNTVTDFRIHFIDEGSCAKKSYKTLGVSTYFLPKGLLRAKIVWTNDEGIVSAEEFQAGGSTRSPRFQIENGETCDALKIRRFGDAAYAEITAHQVGLKKEARCLGQVCRIDGLNSELPYLVTLQEDDKFSIQAQGAWECAGSRSVKINFLSRNRKMYCHDKSTVSARTEGLAAGSQVMITAFSPIGVAGECLATVNSSDDVGLARCQFENLERDVQYVLLAQYETARSWQFLKLCK